MNDMRNKNVDITTDPMYQFAKAASTEFHRPRGLNRRNLLSHNLVARSPKIMVLAGFVLSVGLDGKSLFQTSLLVYR